MLTSFTIGNQTVQVYQAEDEALRCNDGSAFVMSIEDMYEALHCGNILDCPQCPIEAECNAHGDNLPHYLITTHHQQWVSDHPEYFI